MSDRPLAGGQERAIDQDPVLVSYRRLLGRRFHVHYRVRLCVALLLAVAAWLVGGPLQVAELDVDALALVALAVATYGLAITPLARRWVDPERATAEARALLGTSHLVVVLDFAALTAAVWLLGGARSPFVGLYLLHVVVDAVVLSRRAALGSLALAFTLVVGLVLVETSGLATPHLPAPLVLGAGRLEPGFAATLLVAHGIVFAATTFLLLGVVRARRQTERRIRLANAELQRLSEQRRDFLRIALHNLKAPVGAVAMFLRNLRDGVHGPIADEHRGWLDRSLQRLDGLSEFLASMSTLTSLETDIIRSEFGRVDLAKVAEGVVEEYADVAVAGHHPLSFRADRGVPPVVGSARLLREALLNYLTNAIKYTPPQGRIEVRVLERGGEVLVEVEDAGIGIAEEHQAQLFQEFRRLSPRDPLLPGRIEGSGLGLSIVHRVVLAHGGRVGVVSAPGRGSTFWFAIPAAVD
jgi:signal transduction histidine kinase